MEARVRLDPAADGKGTVLGVRAQPRSRRSGPSGVWNGLLKVGIGAPAEDGRANEELLRSLAAMLGVRASSLRLLSGARSRTKRFQVDLEPAACAERLERILAGTGPAPRRGAGGDGGDGEEP